MGFSLRFEGDDANLQICKPRAALLPMDELPPSGLQNLKSGFRLVVQFIVPSLRLVQSRNFLPALKPYSVLKCSYRPDHVSIQSIPQAVPSYDTFTSVPNSGLLWAPEVTL